MRVALLLMALAACGPAHKPQTSVPVVGDVLGTAATDLGKMTSLLRGRVVNGGVWFEDASCANQFAAGEIAPQLRGEFARCLVGLALQPSSRKDQLGDVVVMTYGPGFEVEARIVRESDGPRLSWIGFSSRSSGDALPTVSGAALESLRVAGTPDGPLPAEVMQALDADQTWRRVEADKWVRTPNHFHFTWLKVCLDDKGAVTTVVPYETTSAAHQDAFVAAATAWRFKPFLFANQPIAVCAMVRLTHGAAPPEELPLPLPSRPAIVLSQLVGPQLLEGQRVAGTATILPDDLTRAKLRRGTRLESKLRLCVDETGAVDYVTPIRSTGVAAYDQKLLAGIRAWRFSPYMVNGAAVPLCTQTTFVFTILVPIRIIRHER